MLLSCIRLHVYLKRLLGRRVKRLLHALMQNRMKFILHLVERKVIIGH